MKILYVLPDGTVRSGGNWITVARISEGLKEKGIAVDIIESKEVTEEKIEQYDAVHAFHAFKSFKKISHLIMNKGKTIVVSFTGTDLGQLQKSRSDRYEMLELLNEVDSIVVFHNQSKKELISEGILKEKIRVIPQAATPISIDKELILKKDKGHRESDDIVFLFANGIRAVKRPLEMIEYMTNLSEKYENIKLLIVGPILDEKLGDEMKKVIKGKDWAEYIGGVPHKELQNIMLNSDIVVNSSTSEGMSNTLLEAQQMAKPILASDIAGNRAIVTDGSDGFLFKDGSEYEIYAGKLIENADLRLEMGRAGYESIKKFDLNQEVDMYKKIYERNKR